MILATTANYELTDTIYGICYAGWVLRGKPLVDMVVAYQN